MSARMVPASSGRFLCDVAPRSLPSISSATPDGPARRTRLTIRSRAALASGPSAGRPRVGQHQPGDAPGPLRLHGQRDVSPHRKPNHPCRRHLQDVEQLKDVRRVGIHRHVARRSRAHRRAESGQIRRDEPPPSRRRGQLRKPLRRAQRKRMQQHHGLTVTGLQIMQRTCRKAKGLGLHAPFYGSAVDILRQRRVVEDDEGMFRRVLVAMFIVFAVGGCRLKEEETPMPVIPAPPDVAAAPADASVTASGLASKVLTPGQSNVRPTARSTVKVHYTGWTTDGRMFDSSVARGEAIEFPLDGVIPGWTEGVQLMVVGEKRRFWIPGKLAYGDSNPDPRVPTGTLVFDIELLGVR